MSGYRILLMQLVLSLLGSVLVTACTRVLSHTERLEPRADELYGGWTMLPEVDYTGEMSVEQALVERRSVRDFREQALGLGELGQLLWAAQGITDSQGLRTAPSAGALFPLEVYVIAGNVEGLAPGIYHYHPSTHRLRQVADGDRRAALSQAALGQETLEEAPAVIALSAVYVRTVAKYGERGVRYAHMEVGSVAQNVYLQATALGLGTVFIGAFDDDAVADLLALDEGEAPLCLLPVGLP